jgi:DNA-binding LytR/AlgR family response regulator
MPFQHKISCLIVDDEPPAQGVLKQYIAGVPSLELAAICSSAVDAIAELQKQHIDLIFLDIQMPGLLGTHFIRTLKNPPNVIFTTAYRKFAVEGFELNAVDYLLKPISFERFLRAINKVLHLNLQVENNYTYSPDGSGDASQPFLYLRSERKMVKILFEDILFIESLKDYVKIKTAHKTVLSRQAISSLEEMLPKEEFVRIHRSYIVSLSKIDSFNADSVDVAGTELPIGRLFKQDVSRQLNK